MFIGLYHRLEALRSVDDMVDNIYRMVKKLKKLDNTYIFYTSDTGYHLGSQILTFKKILKNLSDS